LNIIVAYLIRVLEVMFVMGAVGCALTVIPITAYRLFMVLFEPTIPGEENANAQGVAARESMTASSLASPSLELPARRSA
jgi:hypothetical protein